MLGFTGYAMFSTGMMRDASPIAIEAAKWLDGALMGITFDAAGNRDRRPVAEGQKT